MKNYFKVFRVRKFGGQLDESTYQRPEERLVFFDDENRKDVEDAATRAKSHKAIMEARYPARVVVWRPVLGVRVLEIGVFT